MIVSNKYKFVYIDPPKTASMTLDSLFSRNFIGRIVPPPNSKNKKHGRIIPEHAKNYLKIVSVRNPIDRIISYYYDYTRKKTRPIFQSFEEFLDYSIRVNNLPNIFDDQIYIHYCLTKYIEPIGYDIVLKVENLEKDFNSLPFVKTFIPIPMKNKGNYNSSIDITKYLDKIYLWAGEDFKVFGYEN